MYNGVRVLDIHSHVSAPGHGTQALAIMLGAHTPLSVEPRTQELPQFGLTEEGWQTANQRHLTILADRSIDC